MNTRIILTLAASTLLATSGLAFAQADTNAGDHPRVNEVDHRLQNQEEHINNAEANGKITADQAAKDMQHDQNIANREKADEAKHNGHLTKGEQHHLNKSLNKNHHRVKHQKKEDAGK